MSVCEGGVMRTRVKLLLLALGLSVSRGLLGCSRPAPDSSCPQAHGLSEVLLCTASSEPLLPS